MPTPPVAIALIGFFFSGFFCAAAQNKSANLTAVLTERGNRLAKVLDRSQSCQPILSTNRITLCTGPSFGPTEINELKKLGRAECEKKIETLGYKFLSQFDPKKLTQKSWQIFESSTKRAETLHKERLVLFRKDSSPIDCLHEYVHVLQRRPATSSILAPHNRDELYRSTLDTIELIIKKIEKEEKEGNQAYGKTMERKISGTIDKLKTLEVLTNELDEVEVHLLIDFGCRHWWKCSEGDTETALANLYRLKKYLSPEERTRITSEVRYRLNQKYAAVFPGVLSQWLCEGPNPWIDVLLKSAQLAEQEFRTGRMARERYDQLTIKSKVALTLLELEKCKKEKNQECSRARETASGHFNTIYQQYHNKCISE